MKNKLLVICFLISIFLISFASADSIGVFKQNTCVNLIQTCTSCTYVKITSVNYPNSSQGLGLVTMTKTGTLYNYSYCDTSQLGTYKVNGFGDEYGIDTGFAYEFEITGNGNSSPDGVTIVMFSIAYIILLGFLVYVIIFSIGHAVKLDFDILDAAYNYGLFFAVVGVRFLSQTYLGNPDVETILDWVIDIGIWTNIILPTLYFIITLTVGTWMKQKVQGVDF